MRIYRIRGARAARVIYFHGGGFVVGGLESHDDICAEISSRCQVEVVSIDYRLCPEHPHPAAYDDALAAIQRHADRPVILAGDSAGANLAAAAAHTRPGAVIGQVLIYPGLGGDMLDLPSYTQRANAPLLKTADVYAYHALRLRGTGTPSDQTSAPLLAEDYTCLAPAFISVAEYDPLRDDGIEYARRLRSAGSRAAAHVEDQLPHGHLRARNSSTRAKAAFDRVIGAITKFAEG